MKISKFYSKLWIVSNTNKKIKLIKKKEIIIKTLKTTMTRPASKVASFPALCASLQVK